MARPITKSGLYLKFDIALLADIDAAAPARGRTAWIEEACRQRLARDATQAPTTPPPKTPNPRAAAARKAVAPPGTEHTHTWIHSPLLGNHCAECRARKHA